MWIRTHAASSGRRHIVEKRRELSVFAEEVFRHLRAHPALQRFQLLGIGFDVRQGYLVGAPESLQIMSFDFSRRGPSLWRAQDDHRPARATAHALLAHDSLMLVDFLDT